MWGVHSELTRTNHYLYSGINHGGENIFSALRKGKPGARPLRCTNVASFFSVKSLSGPSQLVYTNEFGVAERMWVRDDAREWPLEELISRLGEQSPNQPLSLVAVPPGPRPPPGYSRYTNRKYLEDCGILVDTFYRICRIENLPRFGERGERAKEQIVLAWNNYKVGQLSQ